CGHTCHRIRSAQERIHYACFGPDPETKLLHIDQLPPAFRLEGDWRRAPCLPMVLWRVFVQYVARAAFKFPVWTAIVWSDREALARTTGGAAFPCPWVVLAWAALLMAITVSFTP